MKVYYDLVLILNIVFDFLLLLTTSVVLKRNTKWYRLLCGGIFGGLSILFLFINMSNFLLFIFKFIISVFMVIIAFSFKDIKYFFTNLFYLYICSIVLGGFLYLLNIEFSYKNSGILFINNGFSINMVVLVLFAPFILFVYIKQSKMLKINYNNYYKVSLWYHDKEYKFCAFLDTGNKLYDPYHHRPIILINSNDIDFSYEKSILVPYKTVSGSSVLKCLKADKLIIDNNYLVNGVLFGKSSDNFHIDGVNMILHSEIIGGMK